MQINVWKEYLKTLKIAKKEYILRFINSIFIRGLLLVIPVLISYVAEDVTKGKINSAITLIGVSIIVTIIYRFSECLGSKAYYKLYNKVYSYYNSLRNW